MDETLFRQIVLGVSAQGESLGTGLAEFLVGKRPPDTLLRLVLLAGAWEVRNRTDTDAAVLIDEYLNLARRFGAGDGTKVLHAVLDGFARHERGQQEKTS